MQGYSNSRLNESNVKGKLSRRSPSILVTDSRSSKNRMSAPFAGHAAGLKGGRSDSGNGGQGSSYARGSTPNTRDSRSPRRLSFSVSGDHSFSQQQALSKRSRKQHGKFSDISLDNILSDMSDVPSGRREERLSLPSYEHLSAHGRPRARQYAKMINPLPPRTSKTSEKLVLIPDEQEKQNFLLQNDKRRSSSSARSYGEKMSKEHRDRILSRITAYNVADGLSLKLVSQFLRETHDVSPRLYDECLYVPYCLPLLPGKDGFRIKSNISKKTVGGKTLIDRLIDTSEQRDHHYEYYSGVETMEDMHNNYEIDEGGANDADRVDSTSVPDHLPNPSTSTASFDPSEPQYFAEETPLEQEMREREEHLQIISTNSSTAPSSKQPTKNTKSQDLSKQQHAEIFIFGYGVIVFWNFTEIQEKNILGDIAFADYKSLVIRPLDEQDIETEQFHFEYDMDTERPRIFNDIITLRSGDHIIKLTLSHAIAQSTKLSRFESRISPILGTVSKLPKRLALHGTLGLKREQLLKKSGKLFKLRVDVNLSSSILDTPDFFWSLEPSLHPLYLAMREYLEIDQRVQVLNDRCKVFLEFFDICVDSVAERNMARITWWFIAVIFVSVLVSIAEILVRYFIIKRGESLTSI